ncbi:MAG: hypothetical protein ACE5FG_08515 [Myxococcota bacterium]
MARLKPGTRLRSAVCKTEVMVVTAPPREVEVCCGGAPMLPVDEEPSGSASLSPDAAGGTLLGKRYVNQAGDLELLCTRPGEGSLAADGGTLSRKEAKPLPSSD